MTFVGVLTAIGKDFAKGLTWAVQYAVPAEKLVGLLFPAALPVTGELADATMLIQSAVLIVEQKYAAAGVQDGTGASKLAEVLELAGQAVTALLLKAGVEGSPEYVSRLVNAVVAILNAQPMPAATKE